MAALVVRRFGDKRYWAAGVEVLDQNRTVAICSSWARLIDENDELLHELAYVSCTKVPKPHLRFRNIVHKWGNTAIPVLGWYAKAYLRKHRLSGAIRFRILCLWPSSLHMANSMRFPKTCSSVDTIHNRPLRVYSEENEIASSVSTPHWSAK